VTTLTLSSDVQGVLAYLRATADVMWRCCQDHGLSYSGAEDYVADRGRRFGSTQPLTDAERRIVRDAAAHARRRWRCEFAAKECFWNAQTLVLSDESESLVYCEGYALGHLFPVHHAWASINDKVVDLTWRLNRLGERDAYEPTDDPLEHRIVGEAPEGFVYFGCDDFATAEQIHARIIEYGCCWSFLSGEGLANDELLALYRQPRRRLLCRYDDCPEGHPAHASDDDPRRVSCPTCRNTLGLPRDDDED